MIGISEEVLENAVRDLPHKHGGDIEDLQVCVCGHRRGSHTSEGRTPAKKSLAEAGYKFCQSGKLTCPCSEFRPVLKASSTRWFTYRTVGTGAGVHHALTKGVAASLKNGVEIEWLEGAKCHWAEGEVTCAGGVLPVSYGASGREQAPAAGAATIDVMVCEAHREAVAQNTRMV